MKHLEVNSTKNTPEIITQSGSSQGEIVVNVSGNSFPENAQKFYLVLIDWIKTNQTEISSIRFICDFNYLASSSLICFLDVLRTSDRLLGTDKCSVDWKYEDDDDDMMKVGQNYGKVLNIKINFLPY